MSEDNDQRVAAKKAREPKKNSIPTDVVETLTAGIPSYEKASFVVIGHRNGVRIALPKTNGVSRAYFYGNGDYSLVPKHDAITVFSEEERRAGHRGGIMAEVNFEKGIEAATEALGELIAVVRAAAAPAPKGSAKPKEPKAPKKAKAVVKTEVIPVSDEFDLVIPGNDEEGLPTDFVLAVPEVDSAEA